MGRRAAVVALVALLATVVTTTGVPGRSGSGAPAASAQSVMEGPPAAPFYHADPARLAAARQGEVINSRAASMPAFA